MKNKILFTGGIVWAIIALALLTALVLSFFGVWDFLKIGDKLSSIAGSQDTLILEENYDGSKFDCISISAGYSKVQISFSDTDKLSVRQYDREDAKTCRPEVSGSVLSITADEGRSFGVFTMRYDPRFEIEIPTAFEGKVTIKTSSGDVSVEASGAVNLRDVDIECSSGNVYFKSAMNVQRLGIKTSSGNINTGDLSAADFSIETSSGAVRLAKLKGHGTIRATSGDVLCGLMHADDESTISTSSGTIKIAFDQEMGGQLELSTSSGTIREGEYSLDFDRNGKNAKGIFANSGDHSVRITTASGDIILG